MNGACEYERFPSEESQRAFCQAYLQQEAATSSPEGEPVAVTSAAVDNLVAESRKFVLANHWYWGLWAVNQTVLEGVADFDYITYARSRLGQYYKLRDQGFGQ